MKSFQLHNIKSYLDSNKVEIKPITIFIGKNSSGKSSLIRFPMVLKQTLEESISPLLFYGKYIDYGNYEDIVFNHNEKENVSFSITLDSIELKNLVNQMYFFEKNEFAEFTDYIGYKKNDESEFTLTVEIGRQIRDSIFAGELEIKKYSIEFYNDIIFSVENNEGKYDIYIKGKHQKNKSGAFNGLSFKFLTKNKLKNDENELETKEVDFISRLLRSIEINLLSTASNISYIGPFRRTPDRNYRYQEANKLDIGSDGSYTSELLASYHRKNDKDFFNKLNEWLGEHLHMHIYVEDLKGGMYRIVVEDLHTGVKNNIIDVGFGLSQVLPIIVQVLQEDKNKLNDNPFSWRLARNTRNIKIIEQPELHLHPEAQSNLADLFIKGAQINKKNNFIIETHSEHLILRLRRRILEGSIKSDKVAIYYVEKDLNENRGSNVKKLEIKSDGDIENWPADFFDQDYREIMKINKLKANHSPGEETW